MKSCAFTQVRAEVLCMSAIRGFDAEHIFRGVFGSSNVFRYTKKMVPIITLKKSPFGYFVSNLQFDDRGVPNEDRLRNLNSILDHMNYNQFMDIPELDFTDIENMKF